MGGFQVYQQPSLDRKKSLAQQISDLNKNKIVM